MRLHELARSCAPETVVRGDNPFKTGGAPGQSVYLLSGELKLAFADGSSSVLVGGSDATHWPIVRRESEILNAKAITDIELIRVDDEMLDILMTWDQLSAGAGHANPDKPPEETDWRQMSGAFRLQSLTYGALARLPSASIDQLFQRFERIKVKANETVVREGDEGDFYYIVESGRCTVTRKVGGVDMALAELKAGDAFGEEALVAESTRNATVHMKMAGVLLRLRKEDFIELLREPLLRRLNAAEARQHVATGAATRPNINTTDCLARSMSRSMRSATPSGCLKPIATISSIARAVDAVRRRLSCFRNAATAPIGSKAV